MQPTKTIADFRLQIADLRRRGFAALTNLKSEIFNLKYPSLRHLRRVRTVFLKDTRGRKLTELVTDHVLRYENGDKNFAVVDHEGMADEIGRHHRTARPGLDRFLYPRRIHLVDFLEKMRRNERPFF
jgi:hypothetical protein